MSARPGVRRLLSATTTGPGWGLSFTYDGFGNQRRADFGLADVFGIRRAGDVKGTNGNAFYARIERRRQILDGLVGTNWIRGAEHRLPVAPVENPTLTVVPGFVAYPPEPSYPLQHRTDQPAVVAREKEIAAWSVSPAISSGPCGGPLMDFYWTLRPSVALMVWRPALAA